MDLSAFVASQSTRVPSLSCGCEVAVDGSYDKRLMPF